MINLFEYQNEVHLDSSLEELEDFLAGIWKNRERSNFYGEDETPTQESQRFLQFLYRSQSIKSNKYVGVIHFEGQKINLLPKIFFDPEKDYQRDTPELNNEVNQIHNHVLWWLSYCRKIKFPNYQSSLGDAKSDFFEVLIHLFSKYTRQLLSSTIYQQYQEVSEELPFVKGRLNTNAYISENLTTGHWEKLNCTFDSFVVDNEFNRIVKHVSNLLFSVTKSQENKKYLREILFILDEVTDERATADQCSRITFNPMFGDFEVVRDYCTLFLQQSVSFNYKNDLKLFAFLLPMEYVFEDFIYGFIEKELPEIKVKAQRSDKYLDEDRTFNLKPDLWIQTQGKSVLADTKYKLIYGDERNSEKLNISQSDLYQMLAYAVRFEVKDILLLYPETIRSRSKEQVSWRILDEFASGTEVNIRAHQLPIINRSLFGAEIDNKIVLSELFRETTEGLKAELNSRI